MTVWFSETTLEDGRCDDPTIEVLVAQRLSDGVVAANGNARLTWTQVETNDRAVHVTQLLQRFIRKHGVVKGQERDVTQQRQTPRSWKFKNSFEYLISNKNFIGNIVQIQTWREITGTRGSMVDKKQDDGNNQTFS